MNSLCGDSPLMSSKPGLTTTSGSASDGVATVVATVASRMAMNVLERDRFYIAWNPALRLARVEPNEVARRETRNHSERKGQTVVRVDTIVFLACHRDRTVVAALSIQSHLNGRVG